MKTNFLITGACGVGKTWIMKNLIFRLHLTINEKQGLYQWTLGENIAVLGKYEGNVFDGSDRLSMSIMKDNEKVRPLFESHTVIAEGDRFTNKTYIEYFKPIILKVNGDGAEGRKKRETQQTERHIKSIATRVNNIIPNYIFGNSEECLNFILNYVKDGTFSTEPYQAPKTTLF